MKKILISLFCLFSVVTLSAQEIVIGDIDGDGSVTIKDLTECVNIVTGKSAVRKVSSESLANPNVIDNSALAGMWKSLEGTTITLEENGIASHSKLKDVKGFEYYPYGRMLVLLNSNESIVEVYDVIRSTDSFIVMCLHGTNNYVYYYTESSLTSQIGFSKTNMTLELGASEQLTAYISPSNAIVTNLTWNSSDPSVATVDQQGVVSAISEGSCVISATTNSGSKIKAECSVSVHDNDERRNVVVLNEVKARVAFSKDGEYEWEGGYKSMHSPYEYDYEFLHSEETSKTTIYIEVDKPCDMYFDYGVSSTDDTGWLYIDLDNQSIISGVSNQESKNFHKRLQAGRHTIVLRYHFYNSSYYYVYPGSAYISNMKFIEPFVVKASGSHNGHDYVDLGLSVKWATCNVGASSPEEFGGLYAWGETTTKDNYTWSTLKYCLDSEGKTFSKYEKGGILEPEDDVAHIKFGGDWRMPTKDEIYELNQKCTWKDVELEGVLGLKVTGPNNNYIFIPFTYNSRGEIDKDFNACELWTSSGVNSGQAYSLFRAGHYSALWGGNYRYFGFSVRPVCP